MKKSLNRNDRIKTSKLSSTVLDYYYKYGQNRDLEKYLRLKRQSTSKSSSDSSLKNFASTDSPSLDCERITKSIENLNLSDRKIQFADEDDKNGLQSGGAEAKSTTVNPDYNESNPNKFEDKQKSNESKPIKIEKKMQQQWNGKSKSKSYNFSMESSIEINLPTTSSMPALPVSTQAIDSSRKSYRIGGLESSETQTDTIQMEPGPSTVAPSIESRMPPSNLNAPAVESKMDCLKSTAATSTAVMDPETSPTSSVASAVKSRLEWDSMADIGYNRFIDFKSQSNNNLTTFERSALTKFFARRGLNFDDNLVILAPPPSQPPPLSTAIHDDKSPLQKCKFTQSAIEMREAQKIQADLTMSTKKLSPATDKQLWERALMKYREKYGHMSSKVHKHRVSDGAGSTDTTQFTAPPHHSTPLLSDMSKISQCSTDEFSGQFKNTPTKTIASKKQQTISPSPSPPQRCEKWCQTSLSGIEAVGIQAQQQQPRIQYVSKSVQIEIEQVHESTQRDDDNLTTATSFEFFPPSGSYNQYHNNMHTQTPTTEPTIPSNIPSHHESMYIQEEHPDNKENIPPIDDKENIPPPLPVPPPRPMQHNTDQPNVFKTPPDQTIATAAATAATKSCSGDSSVLSNDLQIGVDLINALIDSRGTDSVTKKKLIRKIVRHLLKSKDTKDITKMIMSYTTEKSNSKVSGVSTLIDVDDKSDGNNSRVEQTAKDTISGISTMSSSSSNVSRAATAESNQTPSNNRKDKQHQNDNHNIEEQTVEAEAETDLEGKKIRESQRKNDAEHCGAIVKGVKQWLLPVTQSEIQKEMARKLSQSQPHLIGPLRIENQNQTNDRQIERVRSNVKLFTSKSNGMFGRLEMEKKTHYDWIDQEIEHLKNLKQLLQQIIASESDVDSSSRGGNISDEKTNSVYAKHNRDYFTIYENFRRTRKQRRICGGNESQADDSSTLIDSSKSSDNSSRFHGKMGSKSHWIHKTTLESPPTTISSGSKPIDINELAGGQPSPPPSLLQRVTNDRAHLAQWDSHLNMQQLVKNRTKLKTPNSDSESIEAYAKECRTKFDQKYAKSSNVKNHQSRSNHRSAAAFIKSINKRDPPIYTKPYSSDSYSDVRQNVRQRLTSAGRGHSKGKQQMTAAAAADITAADAYTSVTDSDGFLSPNSISIGVAANSTSNTTTHQYDTKISVGLQTTDTLQRMPIIQMKNPIKTTNELIEQKIHSQSLKATAETTTMRVNKLTVNKQLQVRPESLAYIIVFKDNDTTVAATAADENVNSMGQERGNQLYANSHRRERMQRNLNWNSESSASGILDIQNRTDTEQLENVIEQIAISSNEECPNSNSSSGSSYENITLQEYLQARRPDFYANAEQRRRCLINLHDLRQQRNEQRKKLLATNVSSNAKMLNRNMKRLLPPPPLAQMRIFKSREIISQTRRKYQKLPEIQQRQQMERDMKIRRNHRILVNVFSKNLQKHVLSGKTDLSNSVMIN